MENILNLKHIFFLLAAVATQVMSYPVVKSGDYCKVNNVNTTISYCALKPDSLKEGEVNLDVSKLREGNRPGISTPEKNSLKYKYIKPENVDPSMVIKPSAEIEMR